MKEKRMNSRKEEKEKIENQKFDWNCAYEEKKVMRTLRKERNFF
jgi:hypothetical protein